MLFPALAVLLILNVLPLSYYVSNKFTTFCIKIKSKKYKLYKNFKWKKSQIKVYKKTYVAKYRYKHENGNKYLALYTKSGKFVGYINTKAAKVVK